MDNREILVLIDSLKNELPLTISHAEVRVPTFTLRGETRAGRPWIFQALNAWTFSTPESVATWAGDMELANRLASRLVGQQLIALDGPANWFDATLVFSAGSTLRQQCSDDDVEAWLFGVVGETTFTGYLPHEQRAWLLSPEGSSS